MNKKYLLNILILSIAYLLITVFPSEAQNNRSKIETLFLKSEVFGNNRMLRIYLPKEYDGRRPFKVLYLNDGQNLFGDSDQGSKNEWRIDEIVDSLSSLSKIEPVIIVGIDNAGKERANEYLPWADIYLSPPVHDPHGNKYPQFLTTEVMPAIEKKYKILSGKENTGIGGSSYGGLIAVYTLIMRSDYFGFALIESPSLYVDNQKIIELADSSFSNWPGRLYLGIGTNELGVANCDSNNQDNIMAVADVEKLYTIISEHSPISAIVVNIDSCAVHNEKAWSKRFPSALEFLLPKERLE